ncbi:ABC transporter ATP-binding protein [Marinilabilia rubra]|uniref:ABC transporter ATP-binding protein n=1 Tax=Marinilabilia rubra TaxID=2162893 RepID=A0A2U2B7N4_9BACT|nr:ABC transporter ATP-binding protein [Marinilabilia rubra]PWD99054.1 ABC transporter ATP-binding protein [Marinilabilia rubra]
MAAIVDKPAITVNRLSHSYVNGKPVLQDVSFSIPENQFTVIMGQNGSGKSTLLRMTAGILPYHFGTVKAKGSEVRELKPKERARKIGFLPQHHKPVFPFKVSEVVLTGRASYVNFTPGKKDVYEVDKALELLGISALKDRVYSDLSGGEQQLVMIARLIAQKPEVLMLDEPISHLDYNNQLRVLKMLSSLTNQNLTIVAVLHDPNMANLFGERFLFVHNRKVHEVDSAETFNHELVREVFYDDLTMFKHEGRYVFLPRVK